MTVIRALTGVIVAILLSASSAFAGVLEDANAAYDRRDYATAQRLFRPLAEQGDAKAQFRLGGMYLNGQGVPQDAAEAVKWWRKAGGPHDDRTSRGGGTHKAEPVTSPSLQMAASRGWPLGR
jgi:hypothetical protein